MSAACWKLNFAIVKYLKHEIKYSLFFPCYFYNVQQPSSYFLNVTWIERGLLEPRKFTSHCLTWRDGPHGASHDVLAALTVDVELLVFDVKFYERQPRVQVVAAVQVPGIYPRIRGGLHVARLQSTVPEDPLAVRAAIFVSHSLSHTARPNPCGTYPCTTSPRRLGYSSGCCPYLRYTTSCCSALVSKLKYVWSVKLSEWNTTLTKDVSDMKVWGCSLSPQNIPGSFLLETSVLALPSTIWKEYELFRPRRWGSKTQKPATKSIDYFLF